MKPGRRNLKWIIGIVVIAATLVLAMQLNLGDNLIYFYTPAEAQAKAAELTGRNIKVGGLVKAGTVNWQAADLDLGFTLTDNAGKEIAVRHRGTPPDMFKENQGVVVEGKISADGNMLISRNLMVKHSEEYKKPDDHSKMDKVLLERSLFKGGADAGQGGTP